MVYYAFSESMFEDFETKQDALLRCVNQDAADGETMYVLAVNGSDLVEECWVFADGELVEDSEFVGEDIDNIG